MYREREMYIAIHWIEMVLVVNATKTLIRYH